MSDATTHLLLPYIFAAQAQKHVTHNEALRILDGLVQLSVLDRDLTAPPGSPADGDRYIVASGATGDWAGWDLNVALWTDGAWLRLPPRTGWRAWVEDEGLLLVYDGAGWVGTTPAALQNLALLGLGTTADGSNPFSAKLNAALWTAKTVAEGGTGDLFYTMNKETAGDDLGLTLQTDYVTKALMGLFGTDKFRLAVSQDGSAFFDGFIVDNASGIVDQPRLPRFKAYTNYDNYVGVGTWTKIGLNNTDYNDQGAFDAANSRFVAPVDGTYLFGATLLYKINASATARMRGRLVLNGTTEIRGSFGEISATHVSLATAIWLQTMVSLSAGDAVELQGTFASQTAISPLITRHSGAPRSADERERRTMTPPRSDQGLIRMPQADFEEVLARAAEEGAKRALADVGLEGKEAALDIRDLRSLLDCIRLVRRTAVQTSVRMITTGVMLALLAGIAIKLKIFGGGP